MRRFFLFILLPGLLFSPAWAGKDLKVVSPDRKVEFVLHVDKILSYSLSFKGRPVIVRSPLWLELYDGKRLGEKPHLKRFKRYRVCRSVKALFEKKRLIRDCFNMLKADFRGGYSIYVRAYNDGAAYRFATSLAGTIKIKNEGANFRFARDWKLYIPFTKGFITSFENTYSHIKLSEVGSRLAFMPVLVELGQAGKLLITEAHLEDYPGMFLTGQEGKPWLKGKFAPYVLREVKTASGKYRVERADYIARTRGRRLYPWRVFVLVEKDADLLTNTMVYRLSPSLRLKDVSWIKPGKVAWDWWNANNIYGVDFEAGINTRTYLYYIDFAARYGIEYIIVDEGWSTREELFRINPEMDMKRILDYARSKDVGVILWCCWRALNRELEKALDTFQSWGVKGIKVDFMNRDDQPMVNFYYKVAREAAKRHLVVDFHGAFKPAGLRRAYPNVLTREGVLGLEYCKWTDREDPEHELLIPFIRMVAGPMDFTPGAMNNAQKENFRAIFRRPMSQGTRCHQLAMYVVYESPLQMLCDSPSNYMREPEVMEFLSKVPTVWDETVVLDAKLGDYLVLARRKGRTWYAAAMTDWQARQLEVKFSFLKPGRYRAIIYEDGPNAHRIGIDYKKRKATLTPESTVKIKMAPGGGWVAVIEPEEES